MTQGIYIGDRRPRSKKEVKERVALNAADVYIQATSAFGGEYDGLVSEMPFNQIVFFVGPDPYTSRKFYGQIVRTEEKGIKVT